MRGLDGSEPLTLSGCTLRKTGPRSFALCHPLALLPFDLGQIPDSAEHDAMVAEFERWAEGGDSLTVEYVPGRAGIRIWRPMQVEVSGPWDDNAQRLWDAIEGAENA